MSTQQRNPNKQTTRSRPWRENIEAITVSIIIIVLFKYFILEAYKIPTGSMQPTLMGWEDGKGGGVFDRVLVDKMSYHFRDPDRYEVVVFRYPLDQSKNFIKRVVGVGPEALEIRDGDLYTAPLGTPEGSAAFKIQRRSRAVQQSQLKSLDVAGEWRLSGQGWNAKGDSIHAGGPGRAVFPRTSNNVRDHYSDGYPGKLGPLQHTAGKRSGANPVGDVRTRARVEAHADCSRVFVELREGSMHYQFSLPGPAAQDQAKPSIRVHDSNTGLDTRTMHAESAWKLRAGKAVELAAQNLNDLLEFELDGEVLLTFPIDPAKDRTCTVSWVTEGGGAEFTDIEVLRDVHYTSLGQRSTHWQIPADNYLMLGDNTQDSSDGRDWNLTSFEVPQPDGSVEVVRGNNRGTENPIIVADGNGTATVYIQDEFGERWVFPRNEARALGPTGIPLVPRSLIRGRAVLVVWPMAPSLDVYRLKWVR